MVQRAVLLPSRPSGAGAVVWKIHGSISALSRVIGARRLLSMQALHPPNCPGMRPHPHRTRTGICRRCSIGSMQPIIHFICNDKPMLSLPMEL